MNPTFKRSGSLLLMVASFLMIAPQALAAESSEGNEIQELASGGSSAIDLQYPPRRRPAPRRSNRRRGPSNSSPGLAYIGIGGLGVYNASSGAGVSELIKSGGGFTIFAGARTSPYAAFEVGLTGTIHDFTPENPQNTTEMGVLQAVTIDGKIFLTPESVRFEPYLQLGAGYYVLSSDVFASNELHGLGIQAGAGVDIRLNPAVAIGVRGVYKGVFVNNDYDTAYWGVPPESAVMSMVNGEMNIQFYF